VTPFTLVMAYYENAGMLAEQVWKWEHLPADIRENLHVVVVDDGSPTAPASAVKCTPSAAIGLASFQLWRMGVDVRWNQDACRNIGVREAPTSWVLLTDMDHVVPEATWRRLMLGKLKKRRVYRFGRVTAPAMTPYKHHPNSWALTRDMYWQAGGYDETLAGRYGTDGDFLNRVRRTAETEDLPEVLIRYPRELIPDASTTTLERKSQADKEAINRLIKARTSDAAPLLHFSFPCARVL
jgi:hypothetical protein